MDQLAGLGQPRRLEMLDAFAVQEVQATILSRTLPLRRNEPRDGRAEHLAFGIAEDVFSATIPARDVAARVLADDRVGRRLHERGQPAGDGFGCDARRDVAVVDSQGTDVSMLEQIDLEGFDVAPGAVLVPDAQRHGAQRARLPENVHAADDLGDVVRVHEIECAVPDHFLWPIPQQACDRRAFVDDFPARVDQMEAVPRRLHQRAEERLAAPQRLLGSFALGDVVEDDDEVLSIGAVYRQRKPDAGRLHENFAPLGDSAEDRSFVQLDDLVAAHECTRDQLADLLPDDAVQPGDDLESAVDLQVHEVDQSPAIEYRATGGIPLQHVLEQIAVTLFRAAQRFPDLPGGRDVLDRSVQADDAAVLVLARHDHAVNPDSDAVVAREREFVVLRLTGREGGSHAGLEKRTVFIVEEGPVLVVVAGRTQNGIASEYFEYLRRPDDRRCHWIPLPVADLPDVLCLVQALKGALGRLLGTNARGDVLAQRAIGCFELQRLLLQLADQRRVVEPELRRLMLHRARERYRAGRGHPGLHLAELREELFRLARFENEGVRAQAARQPLVLDVRVGGGVDNERNRAEARIGLPLAQQRIAVHDRHQQIGNDQVGRRTPGLEQRLGAIAHGLHRAVAAGQQRLQVGEVFLVVVDDQDAGHGVAHGAGLGAQKWAISSAKVSGSIGFSM